MGDILHGLPAVTALRNVLPATHIGWAVEPRWASLLPPQVVDSIHLVPTRAWKQRPLSLATLREIATLRCALRAQQYQVAIDLQGSIRSALIARLASTGQVFGSAHPRERQARNLYQTKVNLTQTHVIGQASELLAAAFETPIPPAPVCLATTPAAQSWFTQTIGDSGYILLAPTAGWGAKQWPADRYILIAKHLRAQGHRVLINSSPEQDPISSHIATASGSELITCSVEQLIPLTRRAALVLGGDTGPVHLAAAQQTPVVALFGPTDPARNGPSFPGSHAIVLRDKASRLDHRRHPDPDPGLLNLTVDQVLQAIGASIHA